MADITISDLTLSDNLDIIPEDVLHIAKNTSGLEYKISIDELTSVRRFTNVSVTSTRQWYTIAKIDNLTGEDTNGHAEFTIRTSYLTRDVSFKVSVPTQLAGQAPVITPLHFCADDYVDQNSYIEARIVYEATNNSEAGALLQISLRYSSSITDEQIMVAMKNSFTFSVSGNQRKWETLTSIVQDDTPDLPDGTLWASATTEDQWCTGQGRKLIHNGADGSTSPITLDFFTGFEKEMYNNYQTFTYESIGNQENSILVSKDHGFRQAYYESRKLWYHSSTNYIELECKIQTATSQFRLTWVNTGTFSMYAAGIIVGFN